MTKAQTSKTGKGSAAKATEKGTAAKVQSAPATENIENIENKGVEAAMDKKTEETKEMTAAEAKEAREKLIRDTNNAEMKAAKAKLKAFAETPEYGKLPKDVQEAITRCIGKAAFGGGGGGGIHTGPTFASETAEMFKEVGTAVHELEIFKKFKMGRSEFRKRVRETLKKSEPASRLWIEFDATKESWVLLAKGVNQPKNWAGKDL